MIDSRSIVTSQTLNSKFALIFSRVWSNTEVKRKREKRRCANVIVRQNDLPVFIEKKKTAKETATERHKKNIIERMKRRKDAPEKEKEPLLKGVPAVLLFSSSLTFKLNYMCVVFVFFRFVDFFFSLFVSCYIIETFSCCLCNVYIISVSFSFSSFLLLFFSSSYSLLSVVTDHLVLLLASRCLVHRVRNYELQVNMKIVLFYVYCLLLGKRKLYT